MVGSPICSCQREIGNWWGFFRRRSAIFCEGDQQFCDSDQESERSDAGFGIVSEVIGMVKEKVEEFDLEQGMRGGRRGQRLWTAPQK